MRNKPLLIFLIFFALFFGGGVLLIDTLALDANTHIDYLRRRALLSYFGSIKLGLPLIFWPVLILGKLDVYVFSFLLSTFLAWVFGRGYHHARIHSPWKSLVWFLVFSPLIWLSFLPITNLGLTGISAMYLGLCMKLYLDQPSITSIGGMALSLLALVLALPSAWLMIPFLFIWAFLVQIADGEENGFLPNLFLKVEAKALGKSFFKSFKLLIYLSFLPGFLWLVFPDSIWLEPQENLKSTHFFLCFLMGNLSFFWFGLSPRYQSLNRSLMGLVVFLPLTVLFLQNESLIQISWMFLPSFVLYGVLLRHFKGFWSRGQHKEAAVIMALDGSLKLALILMSLGFLKVENIDFGFVKITDDQVEEYQQVAEFIERAGEETLLNNPGSSPFLHAFFNDSVKFQEEKPRVFIENDKYHLVVLKESRLPEALYGQGFSELVMETKNFKIYAIRPKGLRIGAKH